jgi:hypothetical protein
MHDFIIRIMILLAIDTKLNQIDSAFSHRFVLCFLSFILLLLPIGLNSQNTLGFLMTSNDIYS